MPGQLIMRRTLTVDPLSLTTNAFMGNTLDYITKYDTVYGGACVGMFVIATLYYYILRPRSTISGIVGPPLPSRIFGHTLQLMLPLQYGDHEFQWQKTYGPVYRIKGCFGQDRLMISDHVAMHYILNTTTFDHAPVLQHTIYLAEGEQSLNYVQGSTHKRFRAAMNVGFNAAAVRKYQPAFENLAHELAERLEATSGSTVDILLPLGIATLSAICDVVLGVSINDVEEEMISNYFQLTTIASSLSATHILADAIGASLPSWVLVAASYLPTNAFTVLRKTRFLAKQLGSRIIRDKMDAARKGLDIDNDIYGSLLTAGQLDARKSAMSEDEIAGQTAVFLLAGHETTTNAVSFALLELSRNPAIQEQLRAEINETLGAVAYDNMPLLNAVIKETLRLYPTIPISERIALSDAIIPLNGPVTSSEGKQITAIHVRKGQLVTVATASYHRLASRWGNDSDEFRPSRWIDGTVRDGDIIGPYANLGVFSGGPSYLSRVAFLDSGDTADSDNVVRAKYAASLMPTLSSGERGLMLRVNKIA
ncbi:Cytochrome P450 [Mycena venus]|uniref:Cytochrome P450 n=1 Tax=Mycena venus TaxID=2733690 RepID=A0A8H6WUJ7_9AGAR|nr:Cytochrome P450 [Mycena venus]